MKGNREKGGTKDITFPVIKRWSINFNSDLANIMQNWWENLSSFDWLFSKIVCEHSYVHTLCCIVFLHGNKPYLIYSFN